VWLSPIGVRPHSAPRGAVSCLFLCEVSPLQEIPPSRRRLFFFFLFELAHEHSASSQPSTWFCVLAQVSVSLNTIVHLVLILSFPRIPSHRQRLGSGVRPPSRRRPSRLIFPWSLSRRPRAFTSFASVSLSEPHTTFRHRLPAPRRDRGVPSYIRSNLGRPPAPGQILHFFPPAILILLAGPEISPLPLKLFSQLRFFVGCAPRAMSFALC